MTEKYETAAEDTTHKTMGIKVNGMLNRHYGKICIERAYIILLNVRDMSRRIT